MNEEKEFGQAIAFRGIDSVLQTIDSKVLQIKYFPDLWYFLGHIEVIWEKEESGEISIDEGQDMRKKLIKQYFKEIEQI
jgi:hypothetical protein